MIPRLPAGAAPTSTRFGYGPRARQIRCVLDKFNSGDHVGALMDQGAR